MLATCFLVTGLTTPNEVGPLYKPRDGLAIALILAATLPYYGRRRAPFAVFAVSMAASAGLYVQRYPAGALPFLLGVGAYTVGAYRPLRTVLLAAVVQDAALVIMLASHSPDFGAPAFVASTAVYGATFLVGWTMQSRRLRLDALEREHGEASLRAASDERLRIAQELHDVVAHSLGVIAIQAGVGMHVLDSDPAEARRALRHISDTSRSSLAEIRRVLGMVRAGEGAGTYAPTPGLAELPSLVREVADAGLAVDFAVAPDATSVPPGVARAAYRIVQESLTNALRHAHAQRATVRLTVQSGGLHVVVTDDGRGHGHNGDASVGGHGLVGMRERVAVYGGTLEIGPGPTGGFRVDATLPYDEARLT